jgi:signal transduction histidine kinase
VGYYVSARRQLIATLEERARTAEREQALIGKAARAAERTSIAREMHDVLAHRISLVALHAGALAYRDDLTRAETAETAATIQANAQLALAELRQILGVLRAGPASNPAVAAVEAPQPTLAELPALVADVREAGMTVQLQPGPLGRRGPAPAMSTTLSRTAFRIVQEALTNARKHAPGAPVDVRLTGSAGCDLEVEIRSAPAPGAAPDPSPSAGVGLLGLDERAQQVGGRLVHGLQPDGTFIVRAWLPWR